MLVPSAEETEAGHGTNAKGSSHASAEAGAGRFAIQVNGGTYIRVEKGKITWTHHEAPPSQAPASKTLHVNPGTSPRRGGDLGKHGNAKADSERSLRLLELAITDDALNTNIAQTQVTTAPLPAGAWLSQATTPGMVPGPVIYSNLVNNGGNQYNGDVRIDYGPPERLNSNRSLDTVSSPNDELDIPALPKSALDAEDVPSRDGESDDSDDTRVDSGCVSRALDGNTAAHRNEVVDHQATTNGGKGEQLNAAKGSSNEGWEYPASTTRPAEENKTPSCCCTTLKSGTVPSGTMVINGCCFEDEGDPTSIIKITTEYRVHLAKKPERALPPDQWDIKGVLIVGKGRSTIVCVRCKNVTQLDFELRPKQTTSTGLRLVYNGN
ncbi:hypothetical protein JMJ78_0000929 [Colletotrichum scovillei]|nr:hypothetical protein JMJ78_0000929 [Colletotrichum scovillei]